MRTHEIEELILELIGPKEASPFELAGEMCDLVPSTQTRELIAKMVMDHRLELTRDLYVRIPRIHVTNATQV